jgi:hypothetical protein
MQAPLQASNDSSPARTDSATTVAQKPAVADKRPEAMAQRKLAEMMNSSPRVAQQRALSDAVHNSPRIVAQRQGGEAFVGEAVGRQPAEETLSQREEKINNTGLPDQLKSGIESLSGMSMDHVRVHYNSDKPAQLQAHAYAQGSEIHLGSGQERHLPHEAWHVVQQMRRNVQPTMLLNGSFRVNDAPELEREADLMGEKAATGTFSRGAHPRQVQRQSVAIDAIDVSPRMIAQRASNCGAGMVSAGIVQRVTAQILEGSKEGVIEDIAIVGRPPHVFNGTMGDHSTAFITTAAGLQAQLKGKTIDEAASILHGLTEGLYNLPGMLLVMPKEHQERLDEALFELEDIWEFLELRMRSRASEGIPPYDQHDAAQIQRFAETSLEAATRTRLTSATSPRRFPCTRTAGSATSESRVGRRRHSLGPWAPIPRLGRS